MKICLVCSFYPPDDGGGIGTYIYTLSNALVAKGHSVTVVCRAPEDAVDNPQPNLTIIRRRPRFIRLLERFVPGISWSYQVSKICKQLIAEDKVDVIEFANWEGAGFIFQRQNPTFPVVVRVHTPFFETVKIEGGNPTFKQKAVCFMEKFSCDNAHSLVSSTVAHANTIADEYNYNIEQFTILPLGIPDTRKPENEVVEWPQGKAPNLLYVSRLEHRKGTLTLLEAVPEMVAEHPDLRIHIVGKDRPHAPEGKFFKAYFAEHYPDYTDNVIFHGFVADEDIDGFYNDATLFVVPSVYESFGLIYVEAMMKALPVVASSGGGIPEVVQHGTTGLLCEPYNASQVAASVNQLLADNALRNEYAKASVRVFESDFTADIMADRTLANYSKVVNKHA